MSNEVPSHYFAVIRAAGEKGLFWGVRVKVDVGSSFAEVKRWGVAQARYGTALGHEGGRWGGWWVRYASGVPAEQLAILGQGGHWKRQRSVWCGSQGVYVAAGAWGWLGQCTWTLREGQGGSGVVSWETPLDHLKVVQWSLLGILGSAGFRQGRDFSS